MVASQLIASDTLHEFSALHFDLIAQHKKDLFFFFASPSQAILKSS